MCSVSVRLRPKRRSQLRSGLGRRRPYERLKRGAGDLENHVWAVCLTRLVCCLTPIEFEATMTKNLALAA
jgi:hypothetical protein